MYGEIEESRDEEAYRVLEETEDINVLKDLKELKKLLKEKEREGRKEKIWGRVKDAIQQ